MTTTTTAPGLDDRAEARERIRKRRDFWPHLLVFALFNGGVLAVWFLAAGGGFPWPALFTLFWGIGVVMHAYDAFWRRPITERDVERELRRRRR